MKNFYLSLFLLFASIIAAQENPPYKNSRLPIEERVNDLLKRMTLEEKIDILGGTGFATKPNERLGIPELRMSDGPVGVRWNPSTAFPASVSMAATWDPELVSGIGSSIGRELKGKGRHVILGPCVNIVRMPMDGRNFESFGEDPFLTSRMAVSYIKGVQKENVAATIKHFAVNNQELERGWIDILVSERALNEIYFPSFKAAVTEADVLCVMSSYNKVNRHYASENDYLLIDKLKNEWGFKGLVMSDWGAVHSSVPTAKGGLDLEMPVGEYLNQKTLLDEIKNGKISQSVIDDKVKRILSVIFKLGLFDNPIWKENTALVNSFENRNSAYETSLASIVLLKNDQNILPLKQNQIKTLAVIGPGAQVARTGGGGSAYVTAIDPVSPLEALKKKLSDKIKIEYAQGLNLEGDAEGIETKYLFTDKFQKQNGLIGEYFSNMDLTGTPVLKRIDKRINFQWDEKSPAENIGEDNFSVRWTGYIKAPKTGDFVLSTSTDDGARLYFEDKLVINDWNDHSVETRSYTTQLEKGKLYKIKMEYYERGGGAIAILGWATQGNELLNAAIETAKKADQVLLFAGTSYQIETEGKDRDNLSLPGEQDDFISKIAEVNKNVVVVLTTGAPVLMDKWINKVNGIVEMWFGGSEGGNAIADVVLGKYNPSGKLPVTFPKRWEDCSAFGTYKTFPARTYYADDIYVGYRHFDKYNLEPLFPFGYGLSYTTFEYSNLDVTPDGNDFSVTFDLKNTGAVTGEEVAQLYIEEKEPKIDRPVKELKAFTKVKLNPGEEKKITLSVSKNALAYFDGQMQSWNIENSVYSILIGSSSRDIKLRKDIVIK